MCIRDRVRGLGLWVRSEERRRAHDFSRLPLPDECRRQGWGEGPALGLAATLRCADTPAPHPALSPSKSRWRMGKSLPPCSANSSLLTSHCSTFNRCVAAMNWSSFARAALYAADVAASIADGVARAKVVLESGAATSAAYS